MLHPNSASGSMRLFARLWRKSCGIFQSLLLATMSFVALGMLVSRIDFPALNPTETVHASRLALQRFSDHPIRNLTLAADGRSVWVTRYPTIYQQVDVATGKPLAKHALSLEYGMQLQRVSGDRQQVIYGTSRNVVLQPIDADGSTMIYPYPPGGELDFAANPVREEIAFARQSTVEIRSLTAVVPVAETTLPSPISEIVWSPDGSRLLAGGTDGVLYFLDGNTLSVIEKCPTLICGSVKLLWSRQGQCVSVMNEYGDIGVWDLAQNTLSKLKVNECFLRCAALSPEGRRVAYVDAHDQLWLLDVHEMNEPLRLGISPMSVNALLFDADGDSLIIGGMDGCLESWSLVDGQLEWSISCDV